MARRGRGSSSSSSSSPSSSRFLLPSAASAVFLCLLAAILFVSNDSSSSRMHSPGTSALLQRNPIISAIVEHEGRKVALSVKKEKAMSSMMSLRRQMSVTARLLKFCLSPPDADGHDSLQVRRSSMGPREPRGNANDGRQADLSSSDVRRGWQPSCPLKASHLSREQASKSSRQEGRE